MKGQDNSTVILYAFHAVHLYGGDVIILYISEIIFVKVPFFCHRRSGLCRGFFSGSSFYSLGKVKTAYIELTAV